MEVRVRIPCQPCAGSGTAYSPEWRNWHVKLESERPVGVPYHIFIQEFAKSNPDPAGPEESHCRACEGTGYQERWLDLTLLRLAQTSELSRLQQEAKP